MNTIPVAVKTKILVKQGDNGVYVAKAMQGSSPGLKARSNYSAEKAVALLALRLRLNSPKLQVPPDPSVLWFLDAASITIEKIANSLWSAKWDEACVIPREVWSRVRNFGKEAK